MKIIEAVTSAGPKITVKEIPPAAVAGMNVAGITLPELVQLVTLLWLVILIVDKVWSLVQRWKKGHAEDGPV